MMFRKTNICSVHECHRLKPACSSRRVRSTASCENYSVFITKSVHLHCQINFNIATNDAVPSHCETLCNIFYVSDTKPNPNN